MTDSHIPSLVTPAPDESGDCGLVKPAKTKRLGRFPAALICKVTAFHRRHPKMLYLWCFLVPALIMGAAHAIIGVWPFGKVTVLTLDLNAQYVFFFEALRDCVWGDSSLLYSFSRSLGGEFMGIYAYYLASPLSYLVALFPRENITEAIYLMLVLKCGLCGLSFGIFLRTKDRTAPWVTLVGATTYALIGYATVMQHNTMWFDNVFMLPLVVLGLFELICHHRYKLYVFALSWAILSNFYVGYMTCIFVAIYSFFLYFSLSPERRNPRGTKAHFVLSFIRIVGFSLIAVLISMVIVIPARYALSFGKNEFSTPDFSLTARFDLVDLAKQFFVCSYDTVRPEGLPVVYCGILTLLLFPCYVVCRRIRLRERVAHLLFALLLVFSFSVNTLDMIWHGFQMPNWLNYRYSYMLCFILVYMASRALSHVRVIPPGVPLCGLGALLFVIAAVSYFRYEKVHPLFTLLFTAVFAILFAVLIVMLIRAETPRTRSTVAALTLVCLMAELGLNAVYDLGMLWKDVGMASRTSYVDYVGTWRPVVEKVEAQDSSFFRMEKLPYRRVNDPSAWGMRGLTASTSTLNADAIAFLADMGISASSHWSEYCGSSPVTDSLLGVRYVMDENEARRVSTTYETLFTDGKIKVYRNPLALPIAFCVSPAVDSVSFGTAPEGESDGRVYWGETVSVFERMNKLLTVLLDATEDVAVYLPVTDYSRATENLSYTDGGAYDHYYITAFKEGDEGSVTFTLGDSGGREIFLYFPSDYMTEATLMSVGDDYEMTWFANTSFGTAYVGVIPPGETRDVTFTVTDKKGFYSVPESKVESYFYALDEEAYLAVFSSLAEGGLKVTSCTEDSFSGTLTAAEGKTTVLTTIPYDAGWNVTVDGEAVATRETLDALLAFDVSPGTHDVEMHYFPRCYKTAIALSALGVLLLGACLAADLIHGHSEKKKKAVQEAAKD